MNNNKKDFIAGMLTAFIMSLVVVAIVLCIKVARETGDTKAESMRRRSETSLSGEEEEGEEPEEKERVDESSIVRDKDVQKKIEYIEKLIHKNYIDDIDKDAIAEGVYDGLMESIDDPYAAYYSPEEWISMQQSNQGIYYGIGAYLQKDTELLYPRITGVIAGTPAEEAGLKEGDIIEKVAEEDVYDLDLTDVVTKIKGEEGTYVHLTIVRGEAGSREVKEFDVVRRKVETPTVSWEMKENDIAYIQISEFDAVTVDQFAEALAEAKGKRMKGLILDLRSNPGGSLAAVVDIARMLLPQGRIVYTEDKYGKQNNYNCDGTHEIDVPMAVLVNGYSASASEILAGAIKDYKKGTLIGTTTFGKGIVQQIFTLEDGSAVKLTVSHYYTPNGNDIHKVGIEPDIKLEYDSEAYEKDKTDNQLEEAIKLLTQ
ncbi:MAG: S41 family peptidase [Lachnospiraceae bacterium]|nr:S41 family peptidase [Lachnospiraceae bacterium]